MHFAGTGIFFDGDGDGVVLNDSRRGDIPIQIRDGSLETADGWGAEIELPRAGNGQPQAIHCVLSLDLGNSRTAGLILDDFDCQEQGRSFHVLPLELRSYSDSRQEDDDDGVFPSIVTGEEIRADLAAAGVSPVSCLRIGDSAQLLSRRAWYEPENHGFDYSFASPKLSFWDRDKLEDVGFVRRVLGAEKIEVVRESEATNGKGRLQRRCDLIGEMVVELLEQAESQANQWAQATQDRTIRKGIRRITHVALTYPACWTVSELNLYLARIQKTVDKEWSERLGLPRVQIVRSVDEASAVLLAYAMNEIDSQRPKTVQEAAEGNDVLWMKEIGGRRECLSGLEAFEEYVARFGILDIGGGTSDLAIDTFAVSRGTGYGPISSNGTKCRISVEAENGICIAGNEFLKNVLEQIVLPAVFQAIDESDESKSLGTVLQTKLEAGNAAGKRLRKDYCTYHFYGMALSYAAQCIKKGDKKELEPFDDLCRVFLEEVRELLKGQFNVDSVVEDIIRNCEAKNLEAIAEETFWEPVIRPFLEVISKQKPDMVLLSGKPFEIPAVRRLFEGKLGMTSGKGTVANTKVRFLEDYSLSQFWKERYEHASFDVKLLTVIGGCMAFMKRTPGTASTPIFDSIRFDAPRRRETVWQSVNLANAQNPNSRVYIRDKDLANCLGCKNTVLSFPVDHPIGFMRRRGGMETMPALLGYVLKLKPGGGSGDNLSIPVWYKEQDESLHVESEFKDKVELEMCVDSGERNWMETANINFGVYQPKGKRKGRNS